MKPALIIMAAGMGSRYGGGGLKQIEAVGPSGELLTDYSVYDALAAGFGKLVFVIKQDSYQVFREAIGKRIEQKAEVHYVFQDIADIPEVNFPETIISKRTKPWGTAHAVLAARAAVSEPFAVITADDYQGPTAFKMLAEFLVNSRMEPENIPYKYAMVGFKLGQTLSRAGSVSRGVCQADEHGYLQEIIERKNIARRLDLGGEITSEDGLGSASMPEDTVVSMSAWGFGASFFKEAWSYMEEFLETNKNNENILLNGEFYIPHVVNMLIAHNKASVRVFSVPEKWCGITNPGDKSLVVADIRKMIENGLYPKNLWG